MREIKFRVWDKDTETMWHSACLDINFCDNQIINIWGYVKRW